MLFSQQNHVISASARKFKRQQKTFETWGGKARENSNFAFVGLQIPSRFLLLQHGKDDICSHSTWLCSHLKVQPFCMNFLTFFVLLFLWNICCSAQCHCVCHKSYAFKPFLQYNNQKKWGFAWQTNH